MSTLLSNPLVAGAAVVLLTVLLAAVLFWPTDQPVRRLERLLSAFRQSKDPQEDKDVS